MLSKAILLVDDSQVLMDITRKILERAGYAVRCATGAAGAREQLIDFEPDGIVLGNELPDGSGLEFCSELRKAHRDTPILFLSNSKEDELAALQAGSSDFLKRPFDFEIFKARIGVLLNVRTNGSQEPHGGGEPVGAEPKRQEQDPFPVIRGPPETKERRKTGKRLSYMVAAAFLVVALILAGIFISLRSNLNLADIPEDGIPLTDLPPGIESIEPGAGG